MKKDSFPVLVATGVDAAQRHLTSVRMLRTANREQLWGSAPLALALALALG